MPSPSPEFEILETVIWCKQGRDEEEEVQHIQMGRVGVDWEFAWSLPGPCSSCWGVCRWLFSLDAWLFRGWRASGESVRQSACSVVLSGAQWCGLLVRPARVGVCVRGARLRCCDSRRKHRCFGAAFPAAAVVLAAPPLFCGSAQPSSSDTAGRRTAATWDVFWSGQDAGSLWPGCLSLPFELPLLLRCWPSAGPLPPVLSLLTLSLTLTGMLEWGRALAALHCRRFAPATPPRCSVAVAKAKTMAIMPPGPPGPPDISPAYSLHAHTEVSPFAAANLVQFLRAKELSAGSAGQQAATPAQQGTPFAGYAIRSSVVPLQPCAKLRRQTRRGHDRRVSSAWLKWQETGCPPATVLLPSCQIEQSVSPVTGHEKRPNQIALRQHTACRCIIGCAAPPPSFASSSEFGSACIDGTAMFPSLRFDDSTAPNQRRFTWPSNDRHFCRSSLAISTSVLRNLTALQKSLKQSTRSIKPRCPDPTGARFNMEKRDRHNRRARLH
ncbi:hypothetical protein N431DRAFT_531217 [Stipitochalara longipes BDJ]|nr:hypothetical protein N431DRAFT_531217 [Stipitochalara longipes BDJ]